MHTIFQGKRCWVFMPLRLQDRPLAPAFVHRAHPGGTSAAAGSRVAV